MTATSIVITSINSINVNARPQCDSLFLLLPVGNVIVGSCALVRPHGHEVVGGRIVFAWALVAVGLSPRVVRDVALQVGAPPVLRVPRRLHQVEQAALALGIV